MHPTLGRGVGGLADLSVESRDARGVDDDAALLVVQLVPGHHGRCLGDDVERADEVDADHALEVGEHRGIALTVEHLGGRRDAGAVHDDAQGGRGLRGGHGCLHLIGARDVGRDEESAELVRDLRPLRRGEVDDRDVGSRGDEPARGGEPEARGPSGDECTLTADLHLRFSFERRCATRFTGTRSQPTWFLVPPRNGWRPPAGSAFRASLRHRLHEERSRRPKPPADIGPPSEAWGRMGA